MGEATAYSIFLNLLMLHHLKSSSSSSIHNTVIQYLFQHVADASQLSISTLEGRDCPACHLGYPMSEETVYTEPRLYRRAICGK